jgi:hypothetical protein
VREQAEVPMRIVGVGPNEDPRIVTRKPPEVGPVRGMTDETFGSNAGNEELEEDIEEPEEIEPPLDPRADENPEALAENDTDEAEDEDPDADTDEDEAESLKDKIVRESRGITAILSTLIFPFNSG